MINRYAEMLKLVEKIASFETENQNPDDAIETVTSLHRWAKDILKKFDGDTEQLTQAKVSGLPVEIQTHEDRLVIDFANHGDIPKEDIASWMTGPRIWIERLEKRGGWKMILHANGNEDPEHCYFVADGEQSPEVLGEDHTWPSDQDDDQP
jgi:hypothetical protein